MPGHRTERISEQIRQELSVMFSREISDPRLAGVSITNVIVTGDLRLAKIYVAPRETKTENDEMMSGLMRAIGYVRRQIAASIDLRFAPEVRFYLDKAVVQGEHIDELLDQVADELAKDNKE